MSEDAPRKRSRFDQTEPEPRKPSRFDRRSRSPSSRHSESRRSRSPLARDSRSPGSGGARPNPSDAAAAAAAAAAKINAELQARKGIQHADVPPIRSSSTSTPPLKTPSSGTSNSKIDGDIYIADGDYIKDIEVNDLRNRYTLTKGSTQKMIKEDTGADVTTRGSYYPDKSMATAVNPPLYLHVTSTSKTGLEQAVAKIEELMKQELPNLVDERRFKRRDEVERDEFGRKKWPEEKITIDMENVPGFNLRAQVVGQGGAYVKHIQQETNCRVQIKGRGSGFMEHSTGEESDEAMYLHVAGPDPAKVQKAKELCIDLLSNVRVNYEHFKANPPPPRLESYTDGYGADANRGSYGGGHGRDRGGRDSYSTGGGYSNNNYNSSYSATSSTPAPGTAGSPKQPQGDDYSAQWAQYYASQPGGDPYAAYGGYQNYVAYYQYYAQQQAQQQQPGQGSPQPPPPGGSTMDAGGAPPPPPPGAAPNGNAGAPPPPPPGGGNSYQNVPPPPGL